MATRKQLARRIAVHREHDDGHYGWGVFVDHLPFVTGVSELEAAIYRRNALDYLVRQDAVNEAAATAIQMKVG